MQFSLESGSNYIFTCLDDCHIKNYISEEPLGVTIDKKMNFNEQVSNLCEKASKKINALTGIFPSMPLE